MERLSPSCPFVLIPKYFGDEFFTKQQKLLPVIHEKLFDNMSNLTNTISVKLNSFASANRNTIPFTVGLINTRSIKNKIISLTESLESKHIQVCCITETWVIDSDVVTFSEFSDKGLKFFNQPRSGRRGGGVGLLCKKSFDVLRVNGPSFSTFEYLMVSLTVNNRKRLLCTVYRTGVLCTAEKSQFLSEIDCLLLFLQDRKEMVVVCGDFNLHVNDINSKIAQDFLDCMESFGFIQLINSPTHTAKATLDLFFVKHPELVKTVTIYDDDILLSDHFLIVVAFNFPTNHTQKFKICTYRDTKSLNINCFLNDLGNLLSSSIISDKRLCCTDDQTQYLMDKITSVLNCHAPTVHKTKLVSSKTFTTDEIREVKRKKRIAERKFYKTRAPDDKFALKLASDKVVQVVRMCENRFYSSKLSAVRKDPKSVYKIVNHLFNKDNEQILPQHLCKEDLANKFAIFFTEKIEKIRCLIVEETHKQPINSSLSTVLSPSSNHSSSYSLLESFRPMDKETVASLMLSTANKYTSVDDIPVDILKSITPTVSDYVLMIVNSSFNEGVFPQIFKLSHVTPIIKNKRGDIDALSNYRPINDLSFFSKVLEKCALYQLREHLIRNNLNFDYQSAYKADHSCETALLRIYDDLLGMLKPKTCIVMVFLDFSSAFDTIDHSVLLGKLETQFHITGRALSWFRSFLSGRSFSVKISNNFSGYYPIKYGVPQGSVLGPAIFSLYSQEINLIIRSYGFHMHMFADDIQIYFESNNPNDQFVNLQNCMRDIKAWASKNFLKLNEEKTKMMYVSTKRPNVHLSSTPFNFEPLVKNLGFYLDPFLDFKSQINKVCQTGFFLLTSIYKQFP